MSNNQLTAPSLTIMAGGKGNAQHSSESAEHYTPAPFVESSRKVMGSIALDPASCELANQVVQAQRIFTSIEDGLTQSWEASTVFLNLPRGKLRKEGDRWVSVPSNGFGESSQAIWWDYLVQQYESGQVQQAIFVAFSLELIPKRDGVLSYPVCFVTTRAKNEYISGSGRIKFNRPENGQIVPSNSPCHGNFIVYLPDKNDPGAIARFYKEFGQYGRVITSPTESLNFSGSCRLLQELDEAKAQIRQLQQSLICEHDDGLPSVSSQHALGLHEIPSTQVHQRIGGSGCLNERPERGLFRFVYYDGERRKEVSFSNLCIALAGEVRRMIEDKREARFIAQYIKDHRG
ncbi:MAG: hypothetical protein ACRC8A_19780 [Microcoleaceae cyanobacterium]